MRAPMFATFLLLGFVVVFAQGSACITRACGEDAQCRDNERCDLDPQSTTFNECVGVAPPAAGEGEGEGNGEGEGEGEGDACLVDNGGCANTAVCDVDAAQRCTCIVGYTGDGLTCTPDGSLRAHFRLEGSAVDATARTPDPADDSRLRPTADRFETEGKASKRSSGTPLTGLLDPIGDNFTITVWVRPESAPLSDRSCIFSDETEAQEANIELVARVDLGVSFTLRASSDENTSASGAGILTVGQWTFIAITGSSAGNVVTVFADDLEVATFTHGSNLAFNRRELTLLNGLTDTSPFDGAIDELRIYNRVLDDTELTALFGEAPP